MKTPFDRLRYLKPAEVASKDNPASWVNFDPMTAMRFECLRAAWGKPLVINSGYRTPAHNKRIGGAPNSAHLKGRATDIRMPEKDQEAFIALARKMGYTGIGRYPTFVHLDDIMPGEFAGIPRPWFHDYR